VRRVAGERLPRPMLLVSFEPAESGAGPKPTERARRPSNPKVQRVTDLEDELRATREDLQGTIEEFQASNEELASAHEEVQSVNEELQSMNEELLTSKEETQSLNEELQTVNSELNAKVGDLERAQDDLINLVSATEVIFVYLDEELRVRRFTPPAQKLFRLIETDVGRPLADLATRVDYPDLTSDAERVLQTLIPSQRDVQTEDGDWYEAEIRPYRTSRNAIEGVILTFVDVTRSKNAAARAEEGLRTAEGIIDTVREPLPVLDDELRVVRANASFYRSFGVERRDTEGVLVYQLGSSEWDIPELRDLLERILPQNESFEDFEVERQFSGIGRRRMLLNARRLRRADAPDRILLAIEDVTARPSMAGGAGASEASKT
jgi:two-component system CheB/CheR fusion protein